MDNEQALAELRADEPKFVPGMQALVEDAKQQDDERRKEDARILTDFTDVSLSSWGYTRPLKMTHGTTVEHVRLPIKSLGLSDVMEAVELDRPMPSSFRKNYSKNTDVARAFTNGKHDVIVHEVDEGDPSYIQQVRRYNTRVAQMWVVYGLAADLYLDGELVLKGKDTTRPNEVVDMEKAMKAIRRLGISQSHYSDIMEDIRLLTADVEEVEQGE